MPDPLPRARRVVAPPPDDGDDHIDDDGDAPRPPRRWLLPAVVALAIFGIGATALLGYMAVKLKQKIDPTVPPVATPATNHREVPSPATGVRAITRASAGQPWAIDGVSVTCTRPARVDDLLQMTAVVRVSDAARQVHFQGWQPSGFLDRHPPVLTDEFNNRYASRSLDFLHDARVQAVLDEVAADNGYAAGPGQVTSAKPRIEMLLFDQPVPAADWLDLDLPGSAVGVSGRSLFRCSLKTAPAESEPRTVTVPQRRR